MGEQGHGVAPRAEKHHRTSELGGRHFAKATMVGVSPVCCPSRCGGGRKVRTGRGAGAGPFWSEAKIWPGGSEEVWGDSEVADSDSVESGPLCPQERRTSGEAGDHGHPIWRVPAGIGRGLGVGGPPRAVHLHGGSFRGKVHQGGGRAPRGGPRGVVQPGSPGSPGHLQGHQAMAHQAPRKGGVRAQWQRGGVGHGTTASEPLTCDQPPQRRAGHHLGAAQHSAPGAPTHPRRHEPGAGLALQTPWPSHRTAGQPTENQDQAAGGSDFWRFCTTTTRLQTPAVGRFAATQCVGVSQSVIRVVIFRKTGSCRAVGKVFSSLYWGRSRYHWIGE